MRRARNGPDCWVLEAKNQNALISISFVSQIQSFYHSLQLIHSSSKLKNRRGQDERHCLFDVCSVGRLVVLSLSMSLLILNQEVVIQFFIGQNSQNVCTIPSLHTLSEIIKNISQLEQIALLIEKPSCHSAFCLFSFHAEQMDWLTHQFRQLIKGSWYKRQTSPDFHFQSYQKKYPVNPFSTTQNNHVLKTHGRISFASHIVPF